MVAWEERVGRVAFFGGGVVVVDESRNGAMDIKQLPPRPLTLFCAALVDRLLAIPPWFLHYP